MATQVALPLANVDYSLALGTSFAPEAGEEVETSYAALRYDFRPASADLEQPGVLLLGKDNRVSLYLANSATCEWDILLSGKYEPYAGGGAPSCTAQGRDCLDCVALFDPTTGSFRLETLLGQYNTKHVRDAPPYRAPVDDRTDLSPGTSGSAGPGPSMSPTGPHPQRRSDSPLASEDGGLPQQSQQFPSSQAHDRYGAGGGAAAAAAPARNSKPPRPPGAGGAGRSSAAGGAGGGLAGKKRQRDAAAGGSGAAGSPSGGPARKTSRLARSSGPRAMESGQGQGQGKKAGGKAGKQATAVPGAASAATQGRAKDDGRFAAHAAAAPSSAPGGGGEDDVDAELLDAFDTFDADLDDGGTADVSGDMDTGGAGTAAGGDTGVPAAASAHDGGADAAAATVAAATAAQQQPPAAAAAASAQVAAVGGAATAPTPTLEEVQEEPEEHEEEEEELDGAGDCQLLLHHQQEPEAAAPSPPRARLVVDMMDDDDGYGYGGEEEDGIGLGIEYF